MSISSSDSGMSIRTAPLFVLSDPSVEDEDDDDDELDESEPLSSSHCFGDILGMSGMGMV